MYVHVCKCMCRGGGVYLRERDRGFAVFFSKGLKSQCIFGRTTKSALCVYSATLRDFKSLPQSSTIMVIPPIPPIHYITCRRELRSLLRAKSKLCVYSTTLRDFQTPFQICIMCLFCHPTRLRHPTQIHMMCIFCHPMRI